MLMKEELQVEERMLMKEELELMMLKEELEPMMLKEELEPMMLKEELEPMMLKEELKLMRMMKEELVKEELERMLMKEELKLMRMMKEEPENHTARFLERDFRNKFALMMDLLTPPTRAEGVELQMSAVRPAALTAAAPRAEVGYLTIHYKRQ